jgi:hypothetical protein
LLEVYVDSLKEFSDEQIRTAIMSVVKKKRDSFFPPISVITDEITGGDEVKQLEIANDGAIEWDKIVRHIGMGAFSDYVPCARSQGVLRLIGGIEKVRAANDDQRHWLRKEFIAKWQEPETTQKMAIDYDAKNVLKQIGVDTSKIGKGEA